MAANGEAGAFFTAERDFIFADQLADVFEADRGLVDSLAVKFCGGVNEFGGGHAAGGRHFPSARFDQIVIDERED